MDRAGADFFRAQRQIAERLKGVAVPVQLPLGSEEHFQGAIDLVTMQAIVWDDASQGLHFEVVEMPAELLANAQAWRAKMIEAAAEANETLLGKYVAGEPLSEDEIKLGLRLRTVAGEIVPMLCATRPTTSCWRRWPSRS